jgi:hypothetical protein
MAKQMASNVTITGLSKTFWINLSTGMKLVVWSLAANRDHTPQTETGQPSRAIASIHV